MKTINGDLLDMTSVVICHQVNCQKVAGAGLALSIRKKHPKWYAHFLTVDGRLGHVDLFSDGTLWIASLYAQYRYGRVGKFTDDIAFEVCLAGLRKQIQAQRIRTEVCFPYGIGCGLAGGDWSVIEPKIAWYFPDAIIVKKF